MPVRDSAPSDIPWWMWIESPLQLLCALEAHQRGLTDGRSVVGLRTGQPGLTATLAATVSMGLPAGVILAPAEPHPSPRGPRWVLGDAFSGAVHQRLAANTLRRREEPESVLIVDDGLATVHLLELLTSDQPVPLSRARVTSLSPLRRQLGLVAWRRLREAADRGGLTVFTAMPVPDALRQRSAAAGITLVDHDFEWLRSRPDPSPPAESTIVLGTSLVANGLIAEEPYRQWLMSLADLGPVAYYPHRREQSAFLAELQHDPRFRVSRVSVAAELTLRGVEPRHTVWSLPSSALVTLDRIVGRSGARLRRLTVPDAWWTPEALPELRTHLSALGTVGLDGGELPTAVPQVGLGASAS